VCNSGVGNEGHIGVGLLSLNQLLQLCDLSNLLKGKNFVLLVSIDGNTCRVVSTVFETPKTLSNPSANISRKESAI
jgi:hypothetical protein